MRYRFSVLLYLLFIGFIGIQFAAIIDDPDHLIETDPDCPICLAAKTQVCITPQVSLSFTPNIIHYLIERSPLHHYKDHYFSTLSIRAPPQS